MKLEYRLTLNDYLEAAQVTYNSWRFLKFGLWVVSIFIVIGGIFDIIKRPYQLYSYFTLIFGICFIPCIQFFMRRGVIDAWKNPANMMQETITMDISEEVLSVKTSSVEAQIKWQIYTHFVETPNLLIVYLSSRVYYIFPKRAFSSEEQLSFRELLSRKVRKS